MEEPSTVPRYLAMAFGLEGREAVDMFEMAKLEARRSGDIRAEIVATCQKGSRLRALQEDDAARRELEMGIRAAEREIDSLDETFRASVVQRAKYELGLVLLRAADYQGALVYLEAGFGSDNHSQVHYMLGTCHARMRSFDRAMEHWKACIDSGGASEFDVYGDLATYHLSTDDYVRASEASVQAARFAGQAGRFSKESYHWWTAGCIAAEHLSPEVDPTIHYMMASLKAALKVEDPVDQRGRLEASITGLRRSLRRLNRSEDSSEGSSSTDCASEKTLRTLQGEGFGYLGLATLLFRASDDADHYLGNAIELLSRGEGTEEEKELLFLFQWSKAALLAHTHQGDEAVELYRRCKTVASSDADKAMCDIECGFRLNTSGDYIGAEAFFTSLQTEYAEVLETEWALKARLLLGLGQSLLLLRKVVEAITALELGRKLWEEQEILYSESLALTYVALFQAYVENEQFSVAFDLASRFDEKVRKHQRTPDYDQLQHLFLGGAHRLLVDNKESERILTTLLESEHGVTNWTTRCGALVALAGVYGNMEDFEAALSKCEEALEVIPESEHGHIANVYMGRAALFRKRADEDTEDLQAALSDYDRALERLGKLPMTPTDVMGQIHAGQAVIHSHLGEFEEAGSKLETAMELAGSDHLALAKLKRVRADLLFKQGDVGGSVAAAREAARLFAQLQMKLQSLEAAWVTLLEGDMKENLFFLESRMAEDERQPSAALVWAERGRMRLYFHLVEDGEKNNNIPGLDPLKFDQDEEEALRCIGDAVKACGPSSVVVEYTYNGTSLHIYVVHAKPETEITVEMKLVDLKRFFSAKENRRGGRTVTLESLIRRTRSEIQRGQDEVAKQSLGVLYRVLLEPVWKVVMGYETVIFAPYGVISLVPFGALYNESQHRFLVEMKNVGVVPSLRVLRRSQAREVEYSQRAACSAFVAGDPEPMGGAGLQQLPSAREEATAIAKQLGVEEVVGSRMTKVAVLEGLSSCTGVAVLATHGIVNPFYPHGALVMQGKGLGDSRPGGDDATDMDEVLTAREIEKLGGGKQLNAGLVVLSACQSGEGAVFSEGVLGLGRAVLQAGAASTVITLWKVDDRATKELMTGMFQHLLKQQSIVEALRSSMLSLLGSGQPIGMWASVVALGSPTLKLNSTVSNNDLD